MPTRAEAWDLLCEYTQSESLRKHALAVEACMRAYAGKLGGDEETWGTVGLLHDFDYERYPDAPNHPLEGSKILRARGYPEEFIEAILSHADYMNVPRVTPLQKTLLPATSWPALSPPSRWCGRTRACWKWSRLPSRRS